MSVLLEILEKKSTLLEYYKTNQNNYTIVTSLVFHQVGADIIAILVSIGIGSTLRLAPIIIIIIIIIISAILAKLVTTGWKSYSSIKDVGFTKVEQLQLITFCRKN